MAAHRSKLGAGGVKKTGLPNAVRNRVGRVCLGRVRCRLQGDAPWRRARSAWGDWQNCSALASAAACANNRGLSRSKCSFCCRSIVDQGLQLVRDRLVVSRHRRAASRRVAQIAASCQDCRTRTRSRLFRLARHLTAQPALNLPIRWTGCRPVLSCQRAVRLSQTLRRAFAVHDGWFTKSSARRVWISEEYLSDRPPRRGLRGSVALER